jgi:hypothetical protein
LCGFFFNFRKQLTANYEGLFPTSSIEDKDKNEKKSLGQEYAEKWNWYGIIRDLCQGDLRRLDEITELNLILVLNDLAYQKETDDLKKHYERTHKR